MLYEKVWNVMDELHMVQPQDLVLVACSGGADSLCLLEVMAKLAETKDFRVEAIHVEHGIRGAESLHDADFVADYCRRCGITLHMRSVDAGEYSKREHVGVEEAARILRYGDFRELALERHCVIAVAHHMEDQAETMLFQMIRGSGMAGMAGMEMVRQIEGVTYIRPMLRISRMEIEEHLKHLGLAYCRDATNQDLDYSRNRIRNCVMPQLEEVNAQAVLHMCEAGELLREVQDYMEQQVYHLWQQCAHLRKDGVCLEIPILKKAHSALQKELLLYAMESVSGSRKNLGNHHVKAVQSLLDKQSGRGVDLPNQMQAYVEYHLLCICRKDPKMGTAGCGVADAVGEAQGTLRAYSASENWDKKSDFAEVTVYCSTIEKAEKELEIALRETGEKLVFSLVSEPSEDFENSQKTYTKYLDYDKIKGEFQIRSRRRGDYLVMNDNLQRKKLSDYFTDHKIPARQRDRELLLMQNQELIWHVGGRIGYNYRIDQNTRRILKVTYYGGI